MSEINRILAEIEVEIIATQKAEPPELAQIRKGEHGDNAGSYGQYFGTYDIAAGMMRDYAGYTLYPLVKIAESGRLSAEQLAFLFEQFDPAYANYLGYSGLRKLGDFAARLREAFKTADSAEIAAGIAGLNRYVNRLNSWSHHYFPWDLGEQFRYPDLPAEDESYYESGKDFVKGSIGDRWLRLTWQPLGISVVMELSTFKNPDLCADVLKYLPFTITQEHAMVTGKSIYAWTPVMSTSPVPWKEMIREAPLGRVRYSQNTGQKFIIQYGPTTEDLYAPVLGQILPEDLPKLRALGEAVWKANYTTKDVIWMTVEAV